MGFVLTFISLVLAGIAIGVLSGMLGVGGGTIIVPVLRLCYGLDAFMATATSLFSIIPISLSGAIAHIRARTCIPKLGVIMGVAGAVTSTLGVYLESLSPGWLVMVVTAIIIAYSAVTMMGKAIRSDKPSRSKKDDAADSSDGHEEAKSPKSADVAKAAIQGKGSGADAEPFAYTPKHLVFAILIGLIAGLASGYVGVGGGFIMVPLMTSLMGIPMKRTSGTSLIAIIILAIPGVIQQAMLGHVDYLAGILICVGAIPGALLGAKLVPRVPERTLRIVFSCLLGVAAIMLVVNEFAL